MKKLCIVSSYGRPCGIAQYVEHLEPALKTLDGWDIEIASLPVDVLRSAERYARKSAAIEIDAIADKLRSADVVNIQFEPGLLGVDPFSIKRRLKKLIDASRKVIITYHTVPFNQGSLSGSGISLIKNHLRSYRANHVFSYLFREVRRNPEKFATIVHTKRERRAFELMGVASHSIYDHPLSFIGEQEKKTITKVEERKRIQSELDLSDSDKILGVFGFLSPYKGIEVAIKATKLLPEKYKLLIFGAVHPEALPHGKPSVPYIEELTELVTPSIPSESTFDGFDRVFFCGAPENRDFHRRMAGCDYLLLPYAEVGQTSSGPASMALDVDANLYVTGNKCFKELNKYARGALTFFDVGNHVELAQKILHIPAEQDKKSAAEQYRKNHNVERVALDYRTAFDALTGSTSFT